MAKANVDNTATLGFEAKLWHAADLMRGKLPATQYRQVLMGLLFLRYVNDVSVPVLSHLYHISRFAVYRRIKNILNPIY